MKFNSCGLNNVTHSLYRKKEEEEGICIGQWSISSNYAVQSLALPRKNFYAIAFAQDPYGYMFELIQSTFSFLL